MGVYITVAAFILFDIITGIIKALYLEGLNSTILRRGLFHKLSEALAVIGAGLVEYGVAYIHFKVDLPVVNVVATYICIMELISILENLCEINPKLCRLFKPYLQKLKTEDKEEVNDCPDRK